MEPNYFSEKVFDKIDFTQNPLPAGEYEYCTFTNCDFSNADLSGIKFLECGFQACNLSLAKIVKTAFGDIKFKDCKMLGLHFENCHEFGFAVQFDNCILNHSSFYKTKLKKTLFKNTKLLEADFTDSDLTSSVFDGCDLAGAKFENTMLEKADFRTSINYSIDPELNRIKKAKFSQSGISGLLDKYNIEIDPGN
jgi:fluoroquinolone resistance protein